MSGQLAVNRVDWGPASFLQPKEDAHQDNLEVGALVLGIAVGVFVEAHDRADDAFGQVAVEGDAPLSQKGRPVVSLAAQKLAGAFPPFSLVSHARTWNEGTLPRCVWLFEIWGETV